MRCPLFWGLSVLRFGKSRGIAAIFPSSLAIIKPYPYIGKSVNDHLHFYRSDQ